MQLLVAVVLLVMARRWRNAPVFAGWAAALVVTHWRSSASARAVSMVHAALLGLSERWAVLGSNQ